MRLYLLLLSLLLINYINCQDDLVKDAIADIFTSPKTSILDGYEEVTKKPNEGFGALTKCGEGSDKGLHLCVPYYNCDAETKTIITKGPTDGFGIIDIRYSALIYFSLFIT